MLPGFQELSCWAGRGWEDGDPGPPAPAHLRPRLGQAPSRCQGPCSRHQPCLPPAPAGPLLGLCPVCAQLLLWAPLRQRRSPRSLPLPRPALVTVSRSPPCFAGPTAAQAFPGGLPPDAGTAGPSTARLSPSRATPLCPSENGRPPLREPRSPSCFSPTLPPANTARRSLSRPFPVFLPPPARGPQEGGPPCSSPRSLAAYSAA